MKEYYKNDNVYDNYNYNYCSCKVIIGKYFIIIFQLQ